MSVCLGKKLNYFLDSAFYTATFLISLFIVIKVIIYCGYGFDYTDESFYLIWMSNPFIYKASLSQFGFIYHPIYKLLNGDITQLRQLNVLMIFFLSTVLSYLILDVIYKEKIKLITNLFYSLVLSAFSISYLIFGLTTPSYNSLNFQGLLLTSIGLLLTCKDKKKSILGWILIGVGGSLTFMAKPSSALLLGALVVIFNLRSLRFNLREISISLITFVAFLLLSSIIIDGSIINFFHRYQNGFIDSTALLGNNFGFSVFRYDPLHLNKEMLFTIILLLVCTVCSIRLLSSHNNKYNNYGKLLILLLIFINVFITLGYLKNDFILSLFENVFFLTGDFSNLIVLLIMPLAILVYSLGNLLDQGDFSSQHKSLALFFLLLPFVFAFGTNVNYWWMACSVPVFWLFSLLIFFSFYIKRCNDDFFLMVPIIISSQLITLVKINNSIDYPYRQPSLLAIKSEKVNIRNSSLILSSYHAHNIIKWKELAKKVGFNKGTPLIDLTGYSPGIAYILGAESIGQPWMFSTYKGSEAYVYNSLLSVKCSKLAKAWLLKADGAYPSKLPTKFLYKSGIDFDNNYQLMGVGDYARYGRSYKFGLYQPKKIVLAKQLKCEA